MLNSIIIIILLIHHIFQYVHGSFDILSLYPQATFDNIIEWGTYKPWLLHGVTQKTINQNPLSFSMIIINSTNKTFIDIEEDDIVYKVIETQVSNDIDSHVNMIYNNGFDYCKQSIIDPTIPINLTTNFFKNNITNNHTEWGSLTYINQYMGANAVPNDGIVNLVFGFILESYYDNDTRYFSYDQTTGTIEILNAATNFWWPEYLKMEIYQNGNLLDIEPGELGYPIEIYYEVLSGQNRSDIWQVDKLAYENLQIHSQPYLTFSNNADGFNTDSSVLLFQIRTSVAANISVMFYYNSDMPILNLPSLDPLEDLFNQKIQYFLGSFNQTFSAAEYDNPVVYDLAINALSNLLGGIAYFYGPIYILEIPEMQPNLPFFTATPARGSFPHGFLWDEGFHDMLICQWNADLCMETLTYWFGSQISNGWIPREQARGPECSNTIPGSFLIQSSLEGNPPTLMLAFDYLISQSNGNDTIYTFLTNNYDKIKLWWTWFYMSQQVNSSDLFIWYGKPFDNNIQYFGSGLDDYPRSDPGLMSKYHLDLQVWEIFFTNTMENLAQFLNLTNDVEYFSNILTELNYNLQANFIDPSDMIFKDVFEPYVFTPISINGNSNLISSLSIPKLSSINQSNNFSSSSYLKTMMEAENYLNEPILSKLLNEIQEEEEIPNNTTYWSSHVGYVSLFPLIFGLIPDNSSMMNATLDTLDPTLNGSLWQPFGILSLAKNDTMFRKNSDYWTGPVWINFQYLISRGLKKYYNENIWAQQLYQQIRNATINNMAVNYQNTSLIWENYNELTGIGQGNHPFTGWSTLIVLLLGENY